MKYSLNLDGDIASLLGKLQPCLGLRNISRVELVNVYELTKFYTLFSLFIVPWFFSPPPPAPGYRAHHYHGNLQPCEGQHAPTAEQRTVLSISSTLEIGTGSQELHDFHYFVDATFHEY